MNTNTYNGWTNYATWRVALEWFECFNPNEYELDPYQLSKYLEDYVTDCLSMDMPKEMTLSYALAFISEVNWYEIADHLIEEEVNNG